MHQDPVGIGGRVAVIGAGFGGLALAIRLQSAGLAVTLYEANDVPGGRAGVFRDQGFTFDAGPTVITHPEALGELWALSGRRMADDVMLVPVEPFYRLCWPDGGPDGDSFDYGNSQVELERQIAAYGPAEVAGFKRFSAYAAAVFEEGYVRLGAVPFLSLMDMVRAAPGLARLRAWRSVYKLAAGEMRHEHLRQAFSFHCLLVGGSPFATSSIYALIHALERRYGVWHAKGGTNALVAAMAGLFTRLGGELKLSCPVDRICIEDGRVTGVVEGGGAARRYEAVASNADVMHTYAHLLRGTGAGKRRARGLSRKRFSMSLFVLHFGLRRQYSGLAQHTILFGPHYRELIEKIRRGPSVPEEFSVYLHSPSVTDDGLAPAGCAAHYALVPVPHLGAAPVDWAVEGPRLAERILDRLDATLMPGVRAELVTMRMFSPEDFRTRYGAHLGSAFSVEPLLTQSAWFRPHNRDPEIANLYLVGAGTHPGAGIPGVVGSAKATAGLMLDAARVAA